jgi:hypothetical protein
LGNYNAPSCNVKWRNICLWYFYKLDGVAIRVGIVAALPSFDSIAASSNCCSDSIGVKFFGDKPSPIFCKSYSNGHWDIVALACASYRLDATRQFASCHEKEQDADYFPFVGLHWFGHFQRNWAQCEDFDARSS